MANYQSAYTGAQMDANFGKAATAIQGVKLNGTELTPDSDKKVNVEAATPAQLSAEAEARTAADSALQTAVSGKQATLVSGTNIKTVNNQSLLGAGNISIEGGTDDYTDLSNKPKINGVELAGDKSLDNLGIQSKISSSNKVAASNVDGLATVATSGSYNDLSNKPTINDNLSVTFTSTNDVITADKSISAIKAALDAGKSVVGFFNPGDGIGEFTVIECKSSGYGVIFGNIRSGREYLLTGEIDGGDVWTLTTKDAFTGASASAGGQGGFVPAPLLGDQDKFLAGDGTWKDVDIPDIETEIDAQSVNTDTAGAKAVYDLVSTKADKTPVDSPASVTSPYELPCDTMTNLGTLTGAFTLTLATAPSDGKLHIYAFTFTADSTTAPTITWPSGISWAGGSAPTITAGKSYECSICQLKALVSEF